VADNCRGDRFRARCFVSWRWRAKLIRICMTVA
jgi:hypothetical protein